MTEIENKISNGLTHAIEQIQPQSFDKILATAQSPEKRFETIKSTGNIKSVAKRMGAALAAIALVAAGVIGGVQFEKKTNSTIYSSGSNGAVYATVNGFAQGISEAKSTAYGYSGDAAGQANAASQKAPQKFAAVSSRKIVKSAAISLKTAAYDKSVTALENAVDYYSGFVQSSSTQGDGTKNARTASFTVRIPSAKFSDFLDSVGKVGRIVSRSVKGEDISQEYLDTQARLGTLETERSRLVKLLSEASKMSDILAIEDKLTGIETSIEEYTGELKKWNSLVDLSTVNISLTETKKGTAAKTDSFFGTAAYVFRQSVGALAATVKTICYVIIAIVPFAAAIGILCLIMFLILRRQKKRGEQNTVYEHKKDGGK